ncbi:MAG TPA: hypothetical protein VHB01_00840 [Nitrosospira sp.]|nr:hypothetical protein [Nitrosospira sp.]
MKPSLLTFLDLKFFRVNVETDFNSKIKADEFDFYGAMLGWNIKHGRDESDGRWWVAVGFVMTNDNAEVICPYTIDVQALGIFSVTDKYPQEKHERLVYENGAALVYGAIREMVSAVTARNFPGSLMLPIPTFLGAYDEYLADKDGQNSPEP